MAKKTKIEEIIHQVFHNQQVRDPAISYSITDKDNQHAEDYSSDYIDIEDFRLYKDRLKKRLLLRLEGQDHAKAVVQERKRILDALPDEIIIPKDIKDIEKYKDNKGISDIWKMHNGFLSQVIKIINNE